MSPQPWREIDAHSTVDQDDIDSGTVNASKNSLDQIRTTRIGFFKDLPSAKPDGLVSTDLRACAAAPGKLPGTLEIRAAACRALKQNL